VLVDIDAAISLKRAHTRNAAAVSRDRMDEQSLEFHRAVYQAYHRLAAQEPERVKLVDGAANMDAIEQAVWELVSAHLGGLRV